MSEAIYCEHCGGPIIAAIWPNQRLHSRCWKPSQEADEQDAARYRFIREGRKGTYNTILIHAGNALDAAIDAAIERGKTITKTVSVP